MNSLLLIYHLKAIRFLKFKVLPEGNSKTAT